MAEDADLTRAVFLVARALTRFAESHKWANSDYWIYYRVNPDVDKVHFVFVAKQLADADPYESTREVWKFLERELGDQPEVLSALGLVVRSKKLVDQGGLYAIGSGYKEFWTFYPMSSETV